MAIEGLPEGLLQEGDYLGQGKHISGDARLGLFERVVWRKVGVQYVLLLSIFTIEGPAGVFDFYLNRDTAEGRLPSYRPRSGTEALAFKQTPLVAINPDLRKAEAQVGKVSRQALDLPASDVTVEKPSAKQPKAEREQTPRPPRPPGSN